MLTLEEFLTEEVKQDIKDAWPDNFKFIDDRGFFTWFEIYRNGLLYIYINNLWLEPKERNKTSLFWLRKFLKDKYPTAVYGYWKRDKRKWHYAKNRRIE